MNTFVDQREPKPAWPPTKPLAFIGGTIFVSGFFLLAVARRDLPVETHALVFLGALLVAFPLLAFTWLVSWSETLVGRSWATGLRRLAASERSAHGTAMRSLRYAGVIWLANGATFWVVVVLGGGAI